MKKIFLSILVLIIALNVQAQIPAGYYNAAAGLTGEPLREALRGIITSGQQTNSYGALYGYYQTTDNYTNGKVWDMYSMKADGTANYWFIHTTDKCGNYSVEGDCYNREHSVPQSWFGSASPMVADLFIVYPTDGKVNGARSNLPYGETATPSYTSTNGSLRGSCSFPGYTGTVFEPIDRFKGDFARTYFYVATRYKNQLSGWSGASFTGNNLSAWTINLMLSWDQLDPVSQKEIDRNNAAYAIQNNRNPYIDHPEWVNCVWATCNTLVFTSNPVTTATQDVSYTYNITYGVDINAETITCPTKPAWLTFTKNEATNTATLTGIPLVSDVGNHSVVLSLTENGVTKTQAFTIVVSPWTPNTDIIAADFANCLPTGWTTVNDAGTKNWTCQTSFYEINAYGSTGACQDWLITSPINMDGYQNETLSFDTYTKYNDAGVTVPELKVRYSTNYTGNGLPSTATWTDLTYTYPAENSMVWTASGNIDVSAITGTNVYFAFYYTSSGTTAGAAALWQLDNVILNGDIVGGIDQNISKIEIYPNPVANILNLKNIAAFAQLSISNTLGQQVYSKKIKEDALQINTNSFKSGLYFIRFQGKNGQIFTHKFIKQ